MPAEPICKVSAAGLTSDNWAELPWYKQIADYFRHITLPVLAMVIGGFASLTMLTKNSFLDEINKQYVLTSRAKGLSENQMLYGHVFLQCNADCNCRNACHAD